MRGASIIRLRCAGKRGRSDLEIGQAERFAVAALLEDILGRFELSGPVDRTLDQGRLEADEVARACISVGVRFHLQLAFYHAGVGAEPEFLRHWLAGAIGLGLKAIVKGG